MTAIRPDVGSVAHAVAPGLRAAKQAFQCDAAQTWHRVPRKLGLAGKIRSVVVRRNAGNKGAIAVAGDIFLFT